MMELPDKEILMAYVIRSCDLLNQEMSENK